MLCFLRHCNLSRKKRGFSWKVSLFTLKWKWDWEIIVMWSIAVQFSCSVVSESLRPHESQHARPPCPSPTSGVHLDSCPLSRWCHPAISSPVVPFSSCPQSLPASESFPMSQLCMRWPKYWSFSFSIILSKEHPGLIWAFNNSVNSPCHSGVSVQNLWASFIFGNHLELPC